MEYSILGCGWLGFPLAQKLIEQNNIVFGSTTSEEKITLFEKNKIVPFLLVIENNQIQGEIERFLNTDILIIDVPFGKQKENFKAYQKLAKLVQDSSISKVVFISSTSVYSNTNGTVFEDTPFEVNPPKKVLVDLEQLFLQHTGFETTVLRFSGLIGGTRNPGNFFKKDAIVKNGLAPINLIHLDDCIQIIQLVSVADLNGEILNATSSTHPTKQEFYRKAAILIGKTPALFSMNEDFTYKIISNEKLKHKLNYTFIHNDLIKLVTTF